jgi:hypothetical protein
MTRPGATGAHRNIRLKLQSAEPQGELATLAGSAAHALNNVLAVLFAASSYLEDDTPSEKAIGRARNAVDSACATGEALSAGLALLALGPTGAATLYTTNAGDAVQQLDAHDLAEIARSLDTVAGIPAAGAVFDSLAFPVRTWLDRETLRSLLVSAAVSLRRRFGKACEIEFSARLQGEPQLPAMSFELRPLLAPDATLPALRVNDHPCAIALETIAPQLEPVGSSVERGEQGQITIRIGAARGA